MTRMHTRQATSRLLIGTSRTMPQSGAQFVISRRDESVQALRLHLPLRRRSNISLRCTARAYLLAVVVVLGASSWAPANAQLQTGRSSHCLAVTRVS